MFDNDDISVDNDDRVYLSDNKGSAYFMEPIDKVKEQDKELQGDAITDKPKLLAFMTISTPSPDHRFLSDRLKTEIHLLSIFQKHKIVLCVHKEIYD